MKNLDISCESTKESAELGCQGIRLIQKSLVERFCQSTIRVYCPREDVAFDFLDLWLKRSRLVLPHVGARQLIGKPVRPFLLQVDNGSDHRVRTIDLPLQNHAQAGLRVHHIVQVSRSRGVVSL